MAWIASWVSSTVVRTTTSKKLPARSGPDDQPTVGLFAGVFDGERMVDSVLDVRVSDAVLSRRAVDLHLA